MDIHDPRSKWMFFAEHETTAVIKAKVTYVNVNETGNVYGCVKVEMIDGKLPEKKLDQLHFSHFNLKNTSQLDVLQELLDPKKIEQGHIIFGTRVKEPDDNVRNSASVNWLYILDGIYLHKKKPKQQKTLILAPTPINAWKLPNTISAPAATEDQVTSTEDDPTNAEVSKAITLSTSDLTSELQQIKKEKVELKELHDVEKSKCESLELQIKELTKMHARKNDENVDTIETLRAFLAECTDQLRIEKENSNLIKKKLLDSEEAREELGNQITVEKDKCSELDKKLKTSEEMKLEIDSQNKLFKKKVEQYEKQTELKSVPDALTREVKSPADKKDLVQSTVNSTLEVVKKNLRQINEPEHVMTKIQNIDTQKVVNGILMLFDE